jgi:hypothetical protein
MPVDPSLFNKVAAKLASQASTEAMIGLPLVGAGIGGLTGAGMGALYNAISDKPELFYDDLGRGAARGALTGGGAGLGMSIGHAATVGTENEPRAVGLGGRAGAGLGYILGRALIARDDDAPAKARVKKKKKTKKASVTTSQGTQPMGIDLNLLRKVAKVYEAAESVDNMPVKQTRESHKACAPGEFGLNKEGNEYMTPGQRAKQHGQEHELSVYENSRYRNLRRGQEPPAGFPYLDQPHRDPAIANRDMHNREINRNSSRYTERFPGSYAVDTAVRGYLPDQARDFRSALMDADYAAGDHADVSRAPLPGIFGMAVKVPNQLDAAARYHGAQQNAAAARQQYNEYMQGEGRGKHPFIQQQIPESAVPAPISKRFPLSGAADKIEKAVGRGMQNFRVPSDLQKTYDQLPKLPRRPFVDDAAPAVKKSSALQFGAHVKQALDPALGMAGLGGAGGVIAGGLSGLIAPGEYEDEEGNVKRRSRLSTALQRALGMGAVGAGLGGAYGMYDRAGAGKAVDFARQLYQSLMGGEKQPAESIRADASTQADPGVKPVKPANYDATLRPAPVKPETSALGNFGTSSLFGGEQQKAPAGTYDPTPEKYVQRRSADARQQNTMSFPYGKAVDPLTGLPAAPFNLQPADKGETFPGPNDGNPLSGL